MCRATRVFFIWAALFCKFLPIFSVGWEELSPKIVIGVLVRNKAFSLPYFFHYLENLKYPRTRIGIIVYEDHSWDKSPDMVQLWCRRNGEKYAFMDCIYNVSYGQGYSDEVSTTNWSDNRMDSIINLRQKILVQSRQRWANYLFMVDADVILVNDNILNSLINILRVNKALAVAPLLNCTSLPFYSNFWDDMSPDGSYIRSDRYLDLKERIIQGTFSVPLINTVILLHINHVNSNFFSFHRYSNSDYANDDFLNFSHNCKRRNITMLINNEELFGYSPGPISSPHQDYAKENEHFMDLKFRFLLYHNRKNPTFLKRLDYLRYLTKSFASHSKLNVEKVFVINLERRKDRFAMVNGIMGEMKINFSYFPAVDGRNLTKRFLERNEIRQLKDYSDPFHKRGLTFGEIGCFLSHFYIWEYMIKHNLRRVLVLEDDMRIKPDFVAIANELLAEADMSYHSWDFLYLGRKIMSAEKEIFINGSKRLLIPNYSYRTTGYVLNQSGALKFINERPLQKLIALDEFIPIMYGKSPHIKWFDHFNGTGTLHALASHPKIVEPSHFKGECEYISDTEQTDIAFT